jgi:hypothetical protein
MRYVTRSVANHVNGISKKDPHLASTPSNGAEAQGTSGRARWALCDSPCRPGATPRITLAPDLANSSIVDGQQAQEGGAEHMARRGGGKITEDPRVGSSAGPSRLNRGAGP